MQLHSWNSKISYLRPACPARDTHLPQQDNPFGNAIEITNAQGEAEKKKKEREREKTQQPKCPKCLEMGQTKTETNPNEMAFTAEIKEIDFPLGFHGCLLACPASLSAAPPAKVAAAAAAAVAQTGAVSSASSSRLCDKYVWLSMCISVCISVCVGKLCFWTYWDGLMLCGMFPRWQNIRTNMSLGVCYIQQGSNSSPRCCCWSCKSVPISVCPLAKPHQNAVNMKAAKRNKLFLLKGLQKKIIWQTFYGTSSYAVPAQIVYAEFTGIHSLNKN